MEMGYPEPWGIILLTPYPCCAGSNRRLRYYLYTTVDIEIARRNIYSASEGDVGEKEKQNFGRWNSDCAYKEKIRQKSTGAVTLYLYPMFLCSFRGSWSIK